MNQLLRKVAILPLSVLAACVSANQQTETTSEGVETLAGASTSGKAVKKLTPRVTAPPEIVKRMQFHAERQVRVASSEHSYLGSPASPMSMSAMKALRATRSARLATASTVRNQVRVAGGARIESPMNDAQADAAVANSRANAPRSGMQMANSNRPGPRLLTNFDGLGAEECCNAPVPFGATVPPDPDIAVGPNHVIVVANVSFEIYDKQGNVVQPSTPFSDFFAGVDTACEPGGPFDPDVVFDEAEGQFILGVDGNGTDYCIAITTNGDPTGTWNRFSFPTDIGGEFFDYPHMGVGIDSIFVGSNQFAPQFDEDGNFIGFAFGGGRIFAVKKSDLIQGNTLNVKQILIDNGNSTPQPAQLHGDIDGTLPIAGPDYIMTEAFDGINHSVWQWTEPFGLDEFKLIGEVDLATASGVPCEDFSCFPISVPQAGSAVQLAGNDFRGAETEYRNDFLWTAQTIACNPGTGTVNCIRWAQIDPKRVTLGSSTDGVVQAGVLSSDDGNSRFFPSLAVDRCNNMAIGYTVSGPDIFPSVAVSGRKRRDPRGQLRSEVAVVSGTESYRSFQNPAAPNRWGDYSGMTIDPDGNRFWYVGEYAGASTNPFTNWRTYVSEHTLDCRRRIRK